VLQRPVQFQQFVEQRPQQISVLQQQQPQVLVSRFESTSTGQQQQPIQDSSAERQQQTPGASLSLTGFGQQQQQHQTASIVRNEITQDQSKDDLEQVSQQGEAKQEVWTKQSESSEGSVQDGGFTVQRVVSRPRLVSTRIIQVPVQRQQQQQRTIVVNNGATQILSGTGSGQQQDRSSRGYLARFRASGSAQGPSEEN
jgi:hypothetical protein